MLKIDLEKAKTPGSPEERRLKKFLASDALMKQMLVADGAKGGKYGPRVAEEHK